MGDISPNFSYEEFKVSSSYPVLARDIVLTKLDKYKCFWLTHLFLQPVRDIINQDSDKDIKIIVSSGIRRGRLNKKIGGVATSDHLFNHYSCAVDFVVGSFDERLTKRYLGTIYGLFKKRQDFIKQWIYYYDGNFIHVSLRDKTDRTGEELYCVSRGSRKYFHLQMEAEDYLRNMSG